MSYAEQCACAAHVALAAQPRSVYGTPDTLIQRGVDALLAQTERLAEAIGRAVAGKTNAKAIEAAINGAARRFGSSSLARPIERELLHGALLGALDSDHEGTTGHPVQVETFAALHSNARIVLASDTSFAQRPMKDAIESFLKKKAVTRDVFDQMEKAAQRRAFTVAGAANEEMVRTVKRELIRQVAVGADLADFGKNAAKRFESAGWVPANPSHVETVFRTNVMGAYSQGRIQQMTQPVVLMARPFWQSMPVGDGPPRQRPTHIMFVLRAADPFWQTAAPPYGYNCRCRLRSLSIKQGAGLVQEGTSIKGLPDPGFTSGINKLFEDTTEPSTKPPKRDDLPANDGGGQAPAPANDPPPEQQPANDQRQDQALPAPRRRRKAPAPKAPAAPTPAPRPEAPKPKAAPKRTRPVTEIQRAIDDLRRQIGNIIRRKKPVPQAEFDALQKRLTELLAELARARVANDL